MNASPFRRAALLFALTSLLIAPARAATPYAAPLDPLEAAFRHPPHAAHPRTFWFWMNGHVTADGITRDLEAMHRVGVGGVLIYDGGAYLPAGPVGYMDPNWQALMTHTIREGKRLGVEIGMHNAPGWSSTGGPWITPALSMQQLVWTETTVRGGGTVDVTLPQPQTNEGYYRDVYVIAFPAAPGEQVAYEQALQQVTVGGRAIDKALLSDGRIDHGVEVAPDKPLLIEFTSPVEVYGVTANTTTKGRFPRLHVEASDDGRQYRPVCTVGSPGMHGIDAPGVATFAPVRARFFRVTPSGTGDVGEFVLDRSPRLPDWNFEANYAYRIGRQLDLPPAGDTPGAIDPKSVRDLSAQLDAQGHLHWDAPAGVWTVLRIGQTSTGQLNVSASSAGTGLECDKFNPDAVAFSFRHVEEKILQNAGADATGYTSVSIDSYEAGMQNWTAKFPEEFQRRERYDLRPFMPAMTGRIVGSAGMTERFLFDLRSAQAALMADAYYKKMGELCHAHGLTYYVEGYGQGVFDEMHVSGSVADVPMAEFWTRTPWAPNRTVKMVSSAAHTYGKRVIGAEAFTGEERTSRWLDYPYSMKVLGDDMFAQGINQFTFHRYAHQPHPTAVPGMAMGPWGFEFERTNTWFDESKAWIDYLCRAQAVLQQGTYVADFLYFTGERPPNNAQFMMPPLANGFNYDLVDAEALLTRVHVENGAFVLPDGARYRVLVLPADLRVMTPDLIRKLAEFARAGATVIGPKPAGSPTLRGYPQSDEEVRRLADELWNPSAPQHVISDRSVDQVIADLKLAPDFTYTARDPDTELSWCHRHTDDAEIYFVANRQRLTVDLLASFRATGGDPELWNPQTGDFEHLAVFTTDGGRTKLPLHLKPAESVFVVFRHAATADHSVTGETWLANDHGKLIDTTLTPKPVPTVTNTFTMSVWAKPDTELRLMPKESATGRVDETGKSYVIAAAEGDVVYGRGHAIAGLAVGRNGVYVIERERESSPAVLVVKQPISGWNHFAVVYRDGTPRLYINGQFVRQGLKTGAVVHPGVDSPPPRPDTTYYFAALNSVARQSHIALPASQGRAFLFEGNLTRPELFTSALSDAAVAGLAEHGLPPLPAPAPVELSRLSDGKLVGRFWETGKYTLSSGAALQVFVPAPQPIDGPWTVWFEPGRGAPDHLTLPQLSPLERNPDPGVKYFSGTATYVHLLTVPDDFIGYGNHIILDLGRVEVLAEVSVNGRRIGTVWKEPYRIDVTNAVHAGENRLEVNVTNLWANRLIGDQQLPAENEYETGESHGITHVPEWYLRGQAKPAGGRVTFVTWHFYDKGEPLVASGLLGPVTLRCTVERAVPGVAAGQPGSN